MRPIFILLFLLNSTFLICQNQEDKAWCKLNCDHVFDTENTELIYLHIQSNSIRKSLINKRRMRFPLRVVFVKETSYSPNRKEKSTLKKAIRQLNKSFKGTKFNFKLDEVEVIQSNLKIEDLAQNQDNLYNTFSQRHDLENIISIYILENKKEFCTITGSSISCARTGGFSYILSDRTTNIVISPFDLENPKIVAHEMGHFFGLYHTFEESLFGKDNFDEQNCYVSGDRLCDTPPDPGAVYEVYVNYSTCEMIGLTDQNGNEYNPSLENYMSYYKPCYLKKYSFTQEQKMVMRLASQLDIRKKLSR